MLNSHRDLPLWHYWIFFVVHFVVHFVIHFLVQFVVVLLAVLPALLGLVLLRLPVLARVQPVFGCLLSPFALCCPVTPSNTALLRLFGSSLVSL